MTAVTKPNEIAREALRVLVTRKITPTPDNYRRIYCEIAGGPEEEPGFTADKLLQRIGFDLPRETPEQLSAVNGFTAAVSAGQWARAYHLLLELVRRPPPAAAGEALPAAAPRLQVHVNPQSVAPPAELCDLLAQMLECGVAARLIDAPALAAEAGLIAATLRGTAPVDVAALRPKLHALCQHLEQHRSQRDRVQDGLLDLLRLLIENVGELVADDQWLRGQIAAVQRAIAAPLDLAGIEAAKTGLQDLIVRQGLLKRGLGEVKASFKQMIASFIDELGQLSAATGDYHDAIENIAQQIHGSEDVEQLQRLMVDIMRETRNVQASTLHAREEVLKARHKVDAAEHRIVELEAELARASEQVRIDSLTGALNRRGLGEAFAREIAVAERRGKPLAVALLDVDNFKELNDSFGHAVGDDALTHLARVVRETVRPGDSVARFGGEEFLVLLPDADAEAAVAVMVRVQRELTRRFFLHEHARVLITFSAGVAGYEPGEPQAATIARADQALYEAKHSGKNRVHLAAPAARVAALAGAAPARAAHA